MAGFTIGKLSEATDTKVQTIRYYESIGLMAPFTRTEGGHRLYDIDDRKRLTFIRHARELGFSIDAIRELLSLSDNPQTSCERADDIASRQLDEVEQRLKRLRALQKELKRMVTECGHGRVSDCRVIEVLSDHRLCQTSH
ncbi:MerR family transcriptional regulator [Aestuariivirga sp. YIM B02566]|jgi:DNA-binding transcriptional MerR regulator|uniref:Helix-turn-helix domain-containing protein n=1 Tax=Taklimakanibacter albus TaxID=2800327 RepID=A0ACC5R5Z1_9HYPH|nr:helix-turn-helix domain-containing protein [Aestuariivirga sp. YIM B02566]MBK1868084.1 helix-turn-helix domain-containing protein [Aestuariivirga sp. YIM B02566]